MTDLRSSQAAHLRRSSLIRLKAPPRPTVSIVIPSRDNLALTLTCLESIQRNTSGISHEVIVVDDASSEQTRSCLASIKGLRVISNQTNVGFLHSCNLAAQAARGKYLLFLNNDTEVTPGWLEALVSVFSDQHDAGIVGAKLLYPDGRLQEAGAVLSREAVPIRCGNLEDANRPEYNYLRETDYCSGACLLIPTELFRGLGGFDPLFAPGYYEDTDLAFRVREAGRKVYYQPFSVVIHHEGGSSASGTIEGIVTNQLKFRAKRRRVLARYPPAEVVLAAAGLPRGSRRRALVIDDSCRSKEDICSSRTFLLCRALEDLGLSPAYLPLDLEYCPAEMQTMQASGIECIYKPFVSGVEAFLKDRGTEFSVVILSSFEAAEIALGWCRRHAPQSALVLDAGEFRPGRRKLGKSPQGRKACDGNSQLSRQQVGLAVKCDALIAKTRKQERDLQQETRGQRVARIPSRIQVEASSAKHGSVRASEHVEQLLTLVGVQFQRTSGVSSSNEESLGFDKVDTKENRPA